MKLIVGLGNPGHEYKNTRHNVGFQLLDYIADKKNIEFNREKFNGVYAETFVNGEKVILLKPQSYMNLSGSVVEKFVSYYHIDLKDVLVIQDDMDMRFGRIKIVYNSSCGGHNGIRDIEKCLGSSLYVRLKIGIARDISINAKDYVLGNFTVDEIASLQKIDFSLVNIIDDFCQLSLDRLMSKYNHR